MHIEEYVPLGPYTTFAIGGPGRFFVRIKTVEELTQALDFGREKKLQTLVLGGGSNVLIDDAGFDGLVIKIEIEGVQTQHNGANSLLIAGAGESWDTIVARATEENMWGLENLSGIPGTVGGAVAGNIGAYGQALSQTLLWVEAFDTATGMVKKMSNTQCSFGYRSSFFKSIEGGHVIVRAAFALSSNPKPDLSYKDLADRFGDTSLDIQAVRDAVLAIRKGKFPDLALEGTAGSFFKNPLLAKDEAEKLRARYPSMPLFALPESPDIKVPLAWLLDHGLSLHGTKIGGARLFEKQPLVIVAHKGTSSSDVRALAELIAKKVFDTFGIRIEPEVKII